MQQAIHISQFPDFRFFSKTLKVIAKNAVKSKHNTSSNILINQGEIESLFDSVSKKQAQYNIAQSNASITDKDREWARQTLRKQ